jgi:hypothetical protein
MTGSRTDLGRIIAHLRAAVLEIERSIASLERQSAELRLNAELRLKKDAWLPKGMRMNPITFDSQPRSGWEQIEREMRCLEPFDSSASDAADQIRGETIPASTAGFNCVTRSKEE